MRRRGALLGIASLSLLAACSVASERIGGSSANHTEGQLTWGNQPYLWGQIDRETADAKDGNTNGKVTSSDHPVAVRIQDWVDRYDKIVRQIVKAKTGETLIAPKPEVRLHASDEVNAWIAMEPMCIAKADKPDPKNKDLIVLGAPNTAIGGIKSCFDAKNWKTDGAVEFFNKLEGPFQVKVSSAAISIDEDTRANQVAILSAVPFVNVHAGLVSTMSEKSTAVILAHELAHYYRAHNTTSVSQNYEFWYDRAATVPERPQAVPNQADYRKMYDGYRAPRVTMDGLKHNARLSNAIMAWGKNWVTEKGHVCEPFVTAQKNWPVSIAVQISNDASNAMTADAQAAYKDLEAKAETCFAALAIDDDNAPMPLSKNTISRGWVTPYLQGSFSGDAWKKDVSSVTTMRDLVTKMDALAKSIDEDAATFADRQKQNRIGLYTFEQEADEIAMELGAHIGITPDETITAFVDLMDSEEKSLSKELFLQYNSGFTGDECKSLLTKGFEKDGKPVYVSLGPLSDEHHAFCYRIFNLWREKEAHKYKPSEPDFPDATPAWSELQKKAMALTAGGTDDTKPEQQNGGTTEDPPTELGPIPEGPAASDDGYYSDDGYASNDDGPTSSKSAASGCSAAPSGTSGAAWFGIALGLAALAKRRRS